MNCLAIGQMFSLEVGTTLGHAAIEMQPTILAGNAVMEWEPLHVDEVCKEPPTGEGGRHASSGVNWLLLEAIEGTDAGWTKVLA